MTDQTRVPGHLGTITLDTDPVVTIQTTALNRSRNIITKQFIGQSWQSALGGQFSATFSGSGAVTVEGLGALEAAYAAANVDASLQVGEASGSTDAGLYEGTLVIGTLNIEASGDGEYEFSIDGTFNGSVIRTPGGSS